MEVVLLRQGTEVLWWQSLLRCHHQTQAGLSVTPACVRQCEGKRGFTLRDACLLLNSYRHSHRFVGSLGTGILPLQFLSSLVCLPRQTTATPCVCLLPLPGLLVSSSPRMNPPFLKRRTKTDTDHSTCASWWKGERDLRWSQHACDWTFPSGGSAGACAVPFRRSCLSSPSAASVRASHDQGRDCPRLLIHSVTQHLYNIFN